MSTRTPGPKIHPYDRKGCEHCAYGTAHCCSIDYGHGHDLRDAIDYCSLHAAAPALLQVAEGALGYLEALPVSARPDEAWFVPLRAAIRAAKAKETK